MNKTQLLKYMETPASLDETSLPQLDELIREFPFFQTARLLYVKNLKNIDSIRFENQLKIAAVYATSRKVLYELVNEQAQTISFTQNELPEPVLEIIEEEIEPEAEAENKTTEEQHFTEIGLETTVLQEEEIVVEEIILEETTNHPSVIATSDEANDKRPTTNDLTTNDQPQTTNKQNDQQQTTNQPNEQTTNDLTTNDQPQTTNKQNDQQQTTNQPNEQTTNDLTTNEQPQTTNKQTTNNLTTNDKQTTTNDITTNEQTINTLADEILMKVNQIRTSSGVHPSGKPGSLAEEILRKRKEQKDEREKLPKKETEKKAEIPETVIIKAEAPQVEEEISTIAEIVEETQIIPFNEPSFEPELEITTNELNELNEQTTNELNEQQQTTNEQTTNELNELNEQQQTTNEQTTNEPNEQKEQEKPKESKVLNQMSFIDWLTNFKENKGNISQTEEKIPDERKIIDQFIQNQPKLKPKLVAERQEDISLASVTDSEEFVTETLAKIFIKQGHFQKAINVYEKLSLKFPEKSIYFADQIEKIKK